MNESNWQRLYRIAEERRSRLGITRGGLKVMGGPSTETMRALSQRTGPPTPRQAASLRDLDIPLGWDQGTAWDLVALDRSDWSEELLIDEEESLIEGPSLSPAENDLRNFGTLVLNKLREMTPTEAEAAMRKISRIVGVK